MVLDHEDLQPPLVLPSSITTCDKDVIYVGETREERDRIGWANAIVVEDEPDENKEAAAANEAVHKATTAAGAAAATASGTFEAKAKVKASDFKAALEQARLDKLPLSASARYWAAVKAAADKAAMVKAAAQAWPSPSKTVAAPRDRHFVSPQEPTKVVVPKGGLSARRVVHAPHPSPLKQTPVRPCGRKRPSIPRSLSFTLARGLPGIGRSKWTSASDTEPNVAWPSSLYRANREERRAEMEADRAEEAAAEAVEKEAEKKAEKATVEKAMAEKAYAKKVAAVKAVAEKAAEMVAAEKVVEVAYAKKVAAVHIVARKVAAEEKAWAEKKEVAAKKEQELTLLAVPPMRTAAEKKADKRAAKKANKAAKRAEVAASTADFFRVCDEFRE